MHRGSRQAWKGFDGDAEDAFEWADLRMVFEKDKLHLLKYLRRLLRQTGKKAKQDVKEARDICRLLGVEANAVRNARMSDLGSVGPESALNRKRRKLR